MSNPKETFYSYIGPDGLKKLAQEWSVNTDISFVKKEIKSGEKVLDLACGYGRVTIPLAEEGVSVVGIDQDKKLIQDAKKVCKEKSLKIQFDIGNMTNLPYNNDSFDKIFCLWNSFTDLLTLTEQIDTLEEIYRVLKVNGQAILILPNGDGAVWKRDIKNSTEGRVVSSLLHGILEKQYVHDKKSFEKLLKDTSFEKYELRHINMHKRRRMLVRLCK